MTEGKKDLFHQIFHGDFRPVDNMRYSNEYKQMAHENYEQHQAFCSLLQDDQKEHFQQLEELDIELSGKAQEENYIEGMKAGIRLMMEVIQ